MKLRPIQIVGLVGLIVLFGFQIYNSRLQQKEREQQQQMIRDLSDMQLQQNDSLYEKNMESIMKENSMNLDKIQQGLDSVGKKLEEDRKKFEEQMKN